MRMLYGNKGEARLIVIMAIAAAVLVLIAFLPKVKNLSDEQMLAAADEKYEIAAERTALVEYNQRAEDIVMAYDGRTKQFVYPRDAKSLVPYGNTKEHEGKIILLMFHAGGQAEIQWLTPNEIAGGSYAEKTNR